MKVLIIGFGNIRITSYNVCYTKLLRTAQLLSQYKVPVISPLSKEESKPLSNLYNVVPVQEAMYKAVFDYMYAKNGNVLAVVSKKKNSTKEYLQQHYKDVKFASYNTEGAIDLESIRANLIKSQKIV